MTEQVKRAPGRPKKPATTPAPTANKSKTVVRKPQDESKAAEYELLRKGGIVTMLPQKGTTVYDKDRDTVREIRYCPNEPSVFVDDQSDKAKLEAVIFRDGRLFIPQSKPNLKRFMELHPGNVVNGGNLFRLKDAKREAEENLAKEFLLNDAIQMVREKDIEELLPVAIYFGYNINASTSDIRYNLLQKAKKSPKEFIESFDNPQVQARSTVQQAKDYQMIRVGKDGVFWFDSNQLIVSVPAGMDGIDVMTRFCLTEKGAATLSNLEDRLSKLA